MNESTWNEAVRQRKHAVVRRALTDGTAPANAIDKHGRTALMRACVDGQMLYLLLDNTTPLIDLNVANPRDGATALLLACRYRSARIVHQLLRQNALVTRDYTGGTVLHRAAANPDASVVKLLIHERVDPCARDRLGRCPLATALLTGNAATALVLLDLRLQLAAGRPSRAQAVLPPSQPSQSSGAFTCTTSIAEMSPRAASSPSASASKMLDSIAEDTLELIIDYIARSADSTYPPSSTDVVATHFPRVGESAIEQSLSSVAQVSRRFCVACRRYRLARWASAASLNAPIACLDLQPTLSHTSMLHLAAASGMEAVVLALIHNGARPDSRDSRGRTPLDAARTKGNTIIASILLAAERAPSPTAGTSMPSWLRTFAR